MMALAVSEIPRMKALPCLCLPIRHTLMKAIQVKRAGLPDEPQAVNCMTAQKPTIPVDEANIP